MSSHKPVRRAQLISPFGVGAMVDFPRDEALMTAGLDAWPGAFEKCPPEWNIVEERLQKRLGVTHFRLPPDYRQKDIDPIYSRQTIPFIRFPRWHFCPQPSCGRMQEVPIFGNEVRRCRDAKHEDLQDFKKPRLVPVRFIAVCPGGHLTDFPFKSWVHFGKQDFPDSEHQLYYRAGRSAALSGISIHCSCGAKRTMAGAFSYNEDTGGPLHSIGEDCNGAQPWLGHPGGTGDGCGKYLRAVQRGASNVYFPKTLSSIYLPLWAEEKSGRIIKILEDPTIWSLLSSGLEEGKYISAERVRSVAAMRRVDAEELRAAAQTKYDGGVTEDGPVSEEEYRRSEYEAFRNERGDENSDLLVEAHPLSEYADGIAPFFSKIALVRKLRETRALSGFSRLLPPMSDNSNLQSLKAASEIRWLPAIIVKGEGLFFEFNENEINEWAERPEIKKRTKSLLDGFMQSANNRASDADEVSAKFLLIHTFAHLLIRQLTFDCGYGSSALRERIYCNAIPGSEPMQGVLIYTAAGDSEGTMGGLVRIGEPGRIEGCIERAVKEATWCSSDPICGESEGQGTDSANLAACHSCTLLPETSCETQNRFLDRALVSGSPADPSIGFFAPLLVRGLSSNPGQKE